MRCDDFLLPGTRKIAHNCLGRGSRRLESKIVQMHGRRSTKIATKTSRKCALSKVFLRVTEMFVSERAKTCDLLSK
jgi:hypothetical protein